MLKAYRYKLEPNKSQRYALAGTLDVGRELYNLCLHQRKLHPLSRYEQSKQLTQLKAEFPVYKNVYSQVLQNVLDRLDKACKSFFRSGFGVPRFKGANRFDSFTYPQAGFSLGGRRLSLAKIGNVKVRLSRPLPRGAVVKTCTMKRSVNGWFATLTFEHQPVPLPANDLAVGIDVGVTTFAKFTDGTEIPNPRIYQNSQAKLRRAQRGVARRKKGSQRRRRAVRQVQKVHLRIRNRRSDFLHKHSTAVIIKYGTVKVEGLNVSAMSGGNLAKQILDCSWSEWFRQLRYKAEEAGRRLVAVDPKYTSQICSQCGCKHPDNRKTQADFACLSCGHRDNADHNAAVNILARNEPLDANVSGVTLCVV